MTIDELITKLESTKDMIKEQGRNPDDYPLSMQIDSETGQGTFGASKFTVEWDGDGCVSGTVLHGYSDIEE